MKRRTQILLAILLALMLGLAACSTDDKDDDASPEATATQQAAPSAEGQAAGETEVPAASPEAQGQIVEQQEDEPQETTPEQATEEREQEPEAGQKAHSDSPLEAEPYLIPVEGITPDYEVTELPDLNSPLPIPRTLPAGKGVTNGDFTLQWSWAGASQEGEYMVSGIESEELPFTQLAEQELYLLDVCSTSVRSDTCLLNEMRLIAVSHDVPLSLLLIVNVERKDVDVEGFYPSGVIEIYNSLELGETVPFYSHCGDHLVPQLESCRIVDYYIGLIPIEEIDPCEHLGLCEETEDL